MASTHLYLGNLPAGVCERDIRAHFSHNHGNITSVKLFNRFGFIDFADSRDARAVVDAFHGTDFMGNRLCVNFARRPRPTNFAPLMYPKQRILRSVL